MFIESMLDVSISNGDLLSFLEITFDHTLDVTYRRSLEHLRDQDASPSDIYTHNNPVNTKNCVECISESCIPRSFAFGMKNVS